MITLSSNKGPLRIGLWGGAIQSLSSLRQAYCAGLRQQCAPISVIAADPAIARKQTSLLVDLAGEVWDLADVVGSLGERPLLAEAVFRRLPPRKSSFSR